MHRVSDPEEFGIEMWKSLAVLVRGQLQQLDDVIHVVQVTDGVINDTEDRHGVRLQHFVGAQFGSCRYVLQARKHRLQISVRLKHSANVHIVLPYDKAENFQKIYRPYVKVKTR